MKRLYAPLIAGAIIVSMLFGNAALAGASTTRHPSRLNARTMSRSYMNSAMRNYTHMSPADFGSARASGWSCWSIAESSGVAPSVVVNAATRRAQSVVSGRVRHHWMSRSAAGSFMRTFRADCWKYLGTAQTPPSGSVPPTGTPGYGYGCYGPWSPSVPPTWTPSVPATIALGSSRGPGMCW